MDLEKIIPSYLEGVGNFIDSSTGINKAKDNKDENKVEIDKEIDQKTVEKNFKKTQKPIEEE